MTKMLVIPALWVNAITYASMITILSIGFTLTYLTSKIPNIAHGNSAGIGIYVVWTLSKIYGFSPYIGFIPAFIIGGTISLILYVLVIRVLDKYGQGSVAKTIATLAIGIVLTALLNIYTFWVRDIFNTYATGFMLKEFDFEIGGYPGIFPVSFFICIGIVIMLHIMLTRTKTGIAMRASSEDPELASVLGINIDNIQKLSWFITGGLACLAGAMYPLFFNSSPGSGAGMMTSVMAASLLGGLNSIYGAIIGGFSIAFSELFTTTWIQRNISPAAGRWRPIIPMIFLVATLLVEPRGLAGIYERFKISAVGRRAFSMLGRKEE